MGKSNLKKNKVIYQIEKKTFGGVSNYGLLAIIIGLAWMSSRDIASTVSGFLWEIAALGVLSRREWGRILFVVMAIANVALMGLVLLSGVSYKAGYVAAQKIALSPTLYTLIFVLIKCLFLFFFISAIVYFTRPKIKAFFKSSSTASPTNPKQPPV